MPCTLITPIAPHTLSFRPVVVPEASDIVIHLSESSRAHARRALLDTLTINTRLCTCIYIHVYISIIIGKYQNLYRCVHAASHLLTLHPLPASAMHRKLPARPLWQF